MGLQELEQLLQEFMQAIQLVMQSGEELSDEFQGQIAQTLELIYNRIEQLRSSSDQLSTKPINIPEMKSSMPSSNIFGFNYDYDNNRLLVKFQGNDGVGQGPVYSYDGVEPYMFNLFKRGAAIAKTTGKNKWGEWWKGKSPSIGAAMHAFIKMGNYPYQKLS